MTNVGKVLYIIKEVMALGSFSIGALVPSRGQVWKCQAELWPPGIFTLNRQVPVRMHSWVLRVLTLERMYQGRCVPALKGAVSAADTTEVAWCRGNKSMFGSLEGESGKQRGFLNFEASVCDILMDPWLLSEAPCCLLALQQLGPCSTSQGPLPCSLLGPPPPQPNTS